MAIDMTFDKEDAKECARRMIASGYVCGGCKFYAGCGIGDRDREGLVNFLQAIDPSGLNITKSLYAH